MRGDRLWMNRDASVAPGDASVLTENGAMQRIMLRSKIHRATITATLLDYEGSITIDADLIDAAKLLPYERVQVLNLSNGHRLETYVIEGERGSGQIELNGPAARLGAVGDKVIVAAYGVFEEAAAAALQPTIIHVDGRNRPV